MPAGSNSDTQFAAAIELDGTVQESFPFGYGRELFDIGLKYLSKLIENTWRTKIFESNIFVIYKVAITDHEYLKPYGTPSLQLQPIVQKDELLQL